MKFNMDFFKNKINQENDFEVVKQYIENNINDVERNTSPNYETEFVDKITDKEMLAEFYSYSIALKDYSNDDYHEMNYGHIATEEELLQAYDQTNENKMTIMLETADGLRFCLEYDAEGGWIYSKDTLRYYRVTEEMEGWFSVLSKD